MVILSPQDGLWVGDMFVAEDLKHMWRAEMDQTWLVGGLEHVLFSYILGIIIPID